MSILSRQIYQQLKDAGFPQPKPSPGQIWWFGYFFGYKSEYWKLHILGEKIPNDASIFCPCVDDIVKFLPEGFILQMWDGRHSCKIETEDTTIRTQGNSFAEAAALVYLELQKNAPNPDVSEPGDV